MPDTTTDNTFLTDVIRGLSKPKKTLDCKYLYDERGSELFDQICDTEEYYPTRTELQIMRDNADSIAYQIDEGVMLAEYGSGSSVKTRILLDALNQPVAYVPIDISEEHLLKTAGSLQLAYPDLEVLPLVADFTKPFELPVANNTPTHVALYFPGSTIGNFTPDEAGELLKVMTSILGPKGGLLIGIDLQKDVSVVEAAYNDAAGVTAAFTLNLLDRINSELDADFNVDAFQHKAIYNAVEHRMEMSIVSLAEQKVVLGNRAFKFSKGEGILTEYSHKYTIEGFAEFAKRYGFTLHKHWTDDREYFGVLHLVLD